LTRRARIALAVAATASLAGAGLLGWAVIVEPGRLVVRETQVRSARWPRPPLRIAVLTDLHVGSFRNGLDRLDEVVARTNAERPDLVVILGDLVIHEVLLGRFVPPETTAAHLAGLHAPTASSPSSGTTTGGWMAPGFEAISSARASASWRTKRRRSTTGRAASGSRGWPTSGRAP
jgi:hypothetical protein